MTPPFDEMIHINCQEEWNATIMANNGKAILIMAHDERTIYYGTANHTGFRYHIITIWTIRLADKSYWADPTIGIATGSSSSEWRNQVPTTKEQFVSILQEHYPEHFEMFLFHPELLP